MKKLFVLTTILVAILFSSCTYEGIVNDFSNMHELSDSLSQVFPDEEIRVNITNGYHVNVSFVNSDLKELERGKKEEIARKVGLITRHFFDKGRIYKGSLTFFVHEKGGIFEYTESTDTYDLWVLE